MTGTQPAAFFLFAALRSSRSLCETFSRADANVYLVWDDTQTGNQEIFFKRSTDNGSTWGVSPANTPAPTLTATPGATHASAGQARTPTFTPTPTLVTPTYTPTQTPIAASTGISITKYYYFGARMVAMRTSAGVTYLFGDHLGSTSASIDANGNLAKQGYFAFGGVRYNVGTLTTDYTFTGQKSDASDGLMFYGARYYDATIGRFNQPDTIIPNIYRPQDLNRYSYVRNNPLKYVDPTGHTVNCGQEDPTCGESGTPGQCDALCFYGSKETPQNKCAVMDGCAPAETGGNQEPCTQNCGGNVQDEFCKTHRRICESENTSAAQSGTVSTKAIPQPPIHPPSGATFWYNMGTIFDTEALLWDAVATGVEDGVTLVGIFFGGVGVIPAFGIGIAAAQPFQMISNTASFFGTAATAIGDYVAGETDLSSGKIGDNTWNSGVTFLADLIDPEANTSFIISGYQLLNNDMVAPAGLPHLTTPAEFLRQKGIIK